MQVRGILETCIYVDDLESARHFYCEMLGLSFVACQADRHLFLRCGEHMFLIFLAASSNSASSDLPVHGATGPIHVAFSIAAAELSQWTDRLRLYDVAIEKTVTWPQGGRSLYFRDPAGNSVELATPSIWGFGDSSPTV